MKNQSIKAVIFDLGKVLLDFDYSRASKNLAPFCEAGGANILDIINQSRLLHQYETGLLTTEEFFQEVKKASRYCGTRPEFEPIFSDIFTPIPEMIALHEGIKGQGIPTYIFSNTNELAIVHIRKKYPFFNNFTGYFLSYEHRCMKPDEGIYKDIETTLGLKGEQIVYIDDRPENIDAGAKRGWNAVLHENPEATRARLHQWGLVKS